jgi:hypothetical protein
MRTAGRLTLLFLLAPMTGWAQKIDVANDKITCDTVYGIVKIKPPPIAQTSSTMTVTSISGSIFSPGGSFGGASYFQFSLGTSGVTGAFTGGNGGSTSTNTFVTSQDLTVALVANACSGAGVKAVNLGLGTVTLQ